MNHVSNCPYCSLSVGPTDTTCPNCFNDLRSGSLAPQKTAQTKPAARAVQAPSDDLDFMGTPVAPSPAADTRRQTGDTRSAHDNPGPQETRRHAPPAATQPDPGAGARASAGGGQQAGETEMYRPRLRPPMAVLHIHDDDGKNSEVVRIRTAEIAIGRTDGEVIIPHDTMMSGKHAKISRRYVNEHFQWVLTDLNSTNGTYLRISSGKLQHHMEIMFGSYRYRFNAAPRGKQPNEPEPENVPQRTMGWQRVSAEAMLQDAPSLVRITPTGEGEEFKFRGLDQVIGSAAGSADVVIQDDPMLSGMHARIHQDEHGRWHIEDLNSCNGVWRSIREKVIDMRAEFQLGEQRFSLRFS